MPVKPDSVSIQEQSATDGALWNLALPRSDKVVLVMDMVESVRLMAADETGTIARWRQFAAQAGERVLPLHDGRLVKLLGDGLMAVFDQPRQAVQAALALHRLLDETNPDFPQALQMSLRAGVNATHVFTDDHDIYGAGVNLAARLVTLAGPGETVVSASVRDGLTDQLDAVVEDMGDCHLKHIDHAVRAYRVAGVGNRPMVPALAQDAAVLEPAVAVIPFVSRSNEPELYAVGELIADAVIHQLGRSGHVRVVSRLSTTALRGRASAADDARVHLNAAYVLSGGYLVQGARIQVFAELADTATQQVLWTDRVQGDVADLLQTESEIAHRITTAASHALLSCEAQLATARPLPTLHSYTLMLGAITLMHRATQTEFRRARDLLDRLVDMHARHAQPLAWIGKWYVLQVAQGWSDEPARDAAEALAFCQRALDRDSQSALAIAVTGQVHGYLRQDLATAERYYQDALAVNPNESLAWLWLGMTAAFRGDGPAASAATERALSLSPIDPLRYYYESLGASAAIAAGRYGRAIELASASLRANRTHSSTYRALAIAQSLSGDRAGAAATVHALLQLEPQFTVRAFLARYPGKQQAGHYTAMLADALAAAGLPP